MTRKRIENLSSGGRVRTVLNSITLSNREDSLYANYADLYLDMQEDFSRWFQLDSGQVERLHNLSRANSDVQSYALAARALRGDTVYHKSPDLPDMLEARLSVNSPDKIKQNVLSESFKIYPNPNSGQITLEISSSDKSSFTYKVFDLTGRCVLADKFSKAEENGLITINLAEIPLSIHEEEITATDQLIVYPNPATNELFLKGGLLQFENIRIYNVLGQLMINTPVNPHCSFSPRISG